MRTSSESPAPARPEPSAGAEIRTPPPTKPGTETPPPVRSGSETAKSGTETAVPAKPGIETAPPVRSGSETAKSGTETPPPAKSGIETAPPVKFGSETAKSGTDTGVPAESGAPRRTVLDRDADLTHRVNRELRRLGWQGGEVSTQDLDRIRAERSDVRFATDVVGLGNQLAQVVMTGDLVGLRGGVNRDEDRREDPRQTIRFDRKQKRELNDGQRRQVAALARAAADGLLTALPHHRLVVRITGYGNGEWSLRGASRTAERAVETGNDRANVVSAEFSRALDRELGGRLRGARPRPLRVGVDVRIEIDSAGLGGDEETEDSRRRADVTFRTEPHPVGIDAPIAAPRDLSDVEVPDRADARGHDANDPTLPMRAFLDILRTRRPPDRTPRPPRPRLRVDQVLWRDQRWMAYISPDDHATALASHPDNPGSLYDNQHSPGFQELMANAVDTYLQGDGIDVRSLGWTEYSRLHTELVRGLSGDFEVTGENGLAAFGLRVPSPSDDTLDELVGRRPLMGEQWQVRQAEADGIPGPLTGYEYHKRRKRTAVMTAYRGYEVPNLVDQVFADFREDIAAADNDHDRLVAIARAVRNLHVLHVHLDGNGRLNVFVLLPRLLMEYGFVPPYLDAGDPTRRSIMNSLGALFNGGYSLDQIATALRMFQPDHSFSGPPAPVAPATEAPAPESAGPFGTPAGPEPDASPRSSVKRPADDAGIDSDESTDFAPRKRSRDAEILPGSARDAVFAALGDARTTARPTEDTSPWVFAKSTVDGPTVLSREGFAEHSLEPIRYLRDHHADLLSLNSVRYNAAHPDYLANCVNVAVSAAQTLSGRRTVPAPSAGPRSGSLVEQHFGRPVRQLATPDDIVTELTNAGPGAHAIVFEIRADGTGHVFNALHDPATDTIALIDVQSGRLASVRAGNDYRILITSGPAESTSDTTLDGQSFGSSPGHAGGEDQPGDSDPEDPEESDEEEESDEGRVTVEFTGPSHLNLTGEQRTAIHHHAQLIIRGMVERLNVSPGRLTIVVRGHGPDGTANETRAGAVVTEIERALRAYLPAAPYVAPRRLSMPHDLRVHRMPAATGSFSDGVTIDLVVEDLDPTVDVLPTWQGQTDPSIGLPARLDQLAAEIPPDLTHRPQPRPRIRLDDLLWHHERWQAYLDPLHHDEAQREFPDDPGHLYDTQNQTGYQNAMAAAVHNNLQGDGIDVMGLDWAEYQRLHREVTANVAGRFRVTGWSPGAISFHALRAQEPAPDTLTERIGGRPLMSPQATAAADNALTEWQHDDDRNAEVVATRYRATETPAVIDEVFAVFRHTMRTATTDQERLIGIARVVRDLHVLHPHSDANGRLNVYLLLPRLLMEYGFTPMYRVNDPARRAEQEQILRSMGALFSGGYTLEQIATAIRVFQR